MKSRVINTKHMVETENGFEAWTSKIKPSLYYGVPAEEGKVWLQSKHSNKMACFKLSEIIGKEQGMIWIYKPLQKFIDKFPCLEGKTFTVHFDLWQDTPFARKKRAGLVKKKGWKKKELKENAKKDLHSNLV